MTAVVEKLAPGSSYGEGRPEVPLPPEVDYRAERIKGIRERLRALMVAGFYDKSDAELFAEWVKNDQLMWAEGMLWDAEQLYNSLTTVKPFVPQAAKGKK